MKGILPARDEAAGSRDAHFAGGVPELYDRLMVPLIFDPYAKDLAARVQACRPSRLLELAAGTGALTRALVAVLDPATEIVATDLNPGMLEQARQWPASSHVAWRQADATQLPFADGEFDCVACQFGAMFFPAKPSTFREVRRVIAPGGSFVFNVWDAIGHNEFADVVTSALAYLNPRDPPRFLARTPHGYHDHEAIARDLRDAGFVDTILETVTHRSRAATAREVAIAYCQGTPLRQEIEKLGGSLQEATQIAADAIAARFGAGPVDAKIQAIVVQAT